MAKKDTKSSLKQALNASDEPAGQVEVCGETFTLRAAEPFNFSLYMEQIREEQGEAPFTAMQQYRLMQYLLAPGEAERLLDCEPSHADVLDAMMQAIAIYRGVDRNALEAKAEEEAKKASTSSSTGT